MSKVVTHNGQLVTLNGKALEVDATDTPPITVDSALSSTSENPVQNKIVTAALAEKITAPTTATVGQIIKVKSVDDAGKPTAWEMADLPSGGGDRPFVKIADYALEEDMTTNLEYRITADMEGTAFACDALYVLVEPVFADTSSHDLLVQGGDPDVSYKGNVNYVLKDNIRSGVAKAVVVETIVSDGLDSLYRVTTNNYDEQLNVNGGAASKAVLWRPRSLIYYHYPFEVVKVTITDAPLAGTRIVIYGRKI